jgi:CDP-diacylglycerol---serine O-phosphatidyltransferase
MKSLLKHIPNFITLGNLLCGVVGIERVFENDMISAFVLVLLAAVLDFFDGFVARLLKIDGEFGKQLDSLADLVTFGVLPGLILHHYLMYYGYCSPNGFCTSRYAWIALPAAAAWRLAKFNISTTQKTGFVGVPTPITGIAFAALVLVFESGDGYGTNVLRPFYSNFYFLTVSPVIGAWLMVSDLPMLALKFGKADPLKVWKWVLLAAMAGVVLVFGKETGVLILVVYVFTSLLANFAHTNKENG